MKKHPLSGAHARSRKLRQNMTEAERRIWRILRLGQMQGYKFRRQVPLGRYIADFVCHEARLIIEIDGGRHDHASAPEIERTGFLESQGYRILRFWNNDVLGNLAGVYDVIAAELDYISRAHPSPLGVPVEPLPLDGGGRGGGDARPRAGQTRKPLTSGGDQQPQATSRAIVVEPGAVTPSHTLPHPGGGILRRDAS